jgi:type I restriction enzyme S subunit
LLNIVRYLAGAVVEVIDYKEAAGAHSEGREFLEAAEDRFTSALEDAEPLRQADVSAWRDVTIAEIAKFASGTGFPHKHQGRSTGDYPFFKVSDMNAPENAREMHVSANWITEDQRQQLKAAVWPAGTVIFPKVGAALKTEKRRILVSDSVFDNNVMGLVPSDGVVPEFLLAFMETIRLGDLSQDGVVPSVNQSIVGSISLQLPPKGDQERIVAVIRAANAEIAALTRQLGVTRSLRHALLADLVTRRDGEASV